MGILETANEVKLFISEGDELDMRGNIVVKAWIQGSEVSLESHQTELYNRFSEKYKAAVNAGK